MPAEGCTAHDERMSRLEQENIHLRERHDKVDAALEKLSNAITALTQESAERKADQEIMAQIFKQLEADRAEFTRLWGRTDDLVDKLNQAELRRMAADNEAEIKRLQEERDEQKNRGRELMKFILAIVAAIAGNALITHLGLKP